MVKLAIILIASFALCGTTALAAFVGDIPLSASLIILWFSFFFAVVICGDHTNHD